MPYLYNGRIIREGRGWTDDNGIKHPPTWASWDEVEKAHKGLIWQDPPPSYDNRFWWDADTPKDIDALKPEWVARVKEQAGSLLAQTDWYVTREAETGVRMPVAVLAYRDAVRAAADQIEADLTPEQELAIERKAMVCSRFQARAALAGAGLLGQVQQFMSTADAGAKLAWDEAVEFRRNSPTIAGLQGAIGLTDEQIDDLFRAAMAIEA